MLKKYKIQNKHQHPLNIDYKLLENSAKRGSKGEKRTPRTPKQPSLATKKQKFNVPHAFLRKSDPPRGPRGVPKYSCWCWWLIASFLLGCRSSCSQTPSCQRSVLGARVERTRRTRHTPVRCREGETRPRGANPGLKTAAGLFCVLGLKARRIQACLY